MATKTATTKKKTPTKKPTVKKAPVKKTTKTTTKKSSKVTAPVIKKKPHITALPTKVNADLFNTILPKYKQSGYKTMCLYIDISSNQWSTDLSAAVFTAAVAAKSNGFENIHIKFFTDKILSAFSIYQNLTSNNVPSEIIRKYQAIINSGDLEKASSMNTDLTCIVNDMLVLHYNRCTQLSLVFTDMKIHGCVDSDLVMKIKSLSEPNHMLYFVPVSAGADGDSKTVASRGLEGHTIQFILGCVKIGYDVSNIIAGYRKPLDNWTFYNPSTPNPAPILDNGDELPIPAKIDKVIEISKSVSKTNDNIDQIINDIVNQHINGSNAGFYKAISALYEALDC